MKGIAEKDDDCDDNDTEILSQHSSLLRKATLTLDIVRRYLKISGVNEQVFTYFSRVSHEIIRIKLAPQDLRQININQYVSL